MKNDLLNNGYVIINNVFSDKDICDLRNVSLRYFNNGGGFVSSTGKAKPDWIKDPKLRTLREKWESKSIDKLISTMIGEKVEFIGHNDLHLNRNATWHKDRLNNDARRFELHSPWQNVNGETMKIYKVNLYLQSHADNLDGLTVIEGSHKYEEMNKEGTIVQLYPKLGDIVIFDQRITHMGKWSGGYDRLLVCMGYGVRNCFFDEFKKGTEFRQNKQNNSTE